MVALAHVSKAFSCSSRRVWNALSLKDGSAVKEWEMRRRCIGREERRELGGRWGGAPMPGEAAGESWTERGEPRWSAVFQFDIFGVVVVPVLPGRWRGKVQEV